jgi:hypothetical protein
MGQQTLPVDVGQPFSGRGECGQGKEERDGRKGSHPRIVQKSDARVNRARP